MAHEIGNCPLCQGTGRDQIYSARDRHYGIAGVYPIVRCQDCSLVFLNPMYTDQELSALYPSDYYAYRDNFSRSRWKEVLKTILCGHVGTLDPEFERPGRMLDLGCGSGWFLSSMRDKGWEAYGVEISDAAADLGRRTAGLNIVSGTIEHAKLPSGYFDYVRSNHSFEHMSRPGETLDEIHRLLRPGGKLLIAVPNIDSLNAKVFRQYWWYLGAPVHPFNYSAKTLSRLLDQHRFCVEKINYNSDWGGILGSTQIWLNRANGRKSTEGPLINSRVLRVVCQWAAKCVDFIRLGDAIEVIATKESARQ